MNQNTKPTNAQIDKVLRELPADKLRRITAHIYDIVESRAAAGKPVTAEGRQALVDLKALGFGG